MLKLSYASGEQTISVPEKATIVEFEKAGRDQIMPGRRDFVGMKKDAKEAADGDGVSFGMISRV